MEVHPGTSSAPESFRTMAAIPAAMDSAERMNPTRRANRRGALEKLMMPSKANLIILRNGYLVEPANRGARVYETVHWRDFSRPEASRGRHQA